MTAHQITLALHLMAIAMGTGLSLSAFINTRLSLCAVPEAQRGLAFQRMMMARAGDLIITLIWVTGLLALYMRGGMAGLGGAFHAKLAFVVLLTLAHGFGRYTGGVMKRTGNVALLPRLSMASGTVFASALIAIVLAVMAFAG